MTVPTSTRLRLALPKGSLQEDTVALLARAGYTLKGEERSYRPSIDDPCIKVKILRPQEIPLLVADGSYDAGITGIDWVLETGADVKVMARLGYGRVRLVLAVPRDIPGGPDDVLRHFIEENGVFRVSTEYLNIASRFLESLPSYRALAGPEPPTLVTPWYVRRGSPRVKVYLSFGATEAKPPEDADAVLDNTATGITLRRNGLRVAGEVMGSEAVLVAWKGALEGPAREKLLDVTAMLRGVVAARERLHIFVNVDADNLPRLLEILPALKGPTVAPLSREGWYSVNTVVKKSEFLRLLPQLRRLAQGLVVYEPRQVLLLGE